MTLIDDIKPPWNTQLKSILVDFPKSPDQWNEGDFVTGFGAAGLAEGLALRFELGHLIAGSGLKFEEGNFPATITFPSKDLSQSIPFGVTFGFEDAKVIATNPFELSTTERTKLWFIPEFNKDLPYSICHQYAGAFDGWSRAVEWLQEKHGYHCDKTIAIDCDFDVMQVWSIRTSACFWTKPIPLSHIDDEKFSGAAICIQDHSWFNLCRCQTNLAFSLSPPCQPWSQGGRGGGVECDNGMSFIHSIGTIKLVRPVIALFEGADTTPTHKHFKILRAGLILAGYKQVWSTISHYHELAMMNRSRWLAVWVRSDVAAEFINGAFKLVDCTKCAWSDSRYSFHVPSQVEHQLFLSHQLEKIYGDFRWLPKSKSHGLSVQSSLQEVLTARCIQEHDLMPTLCASYSQQHELAATHLDSKGIFAVVVKKQNKFAFVDPLRFVPLFGMPLSQAAVLPNKIDLCFHQLGNAITVPHALLTLLVGLTAIGLVALPISKTVMQCWNDRATSPFMIVLRNADFIFIVPPHHLCGWIPRCLSTKDFKILIRARIDSSPFLLKCHPFDTILSVILRLGLVDPQSQDVTCQSDFHCVTWDSNVGNFEGCTISISKGPFSCLQIAIPLSTTQGEDDQDKHGSHISVSVFFPKSNLRMDAVSVENADYQDSQFVPNKHSDAIALGLERLTVDHQMIATDALEPTCIKRSRPDDFSSCKLPRKVGPLVETIKCVAFCTGSSHPTMISIPIDAPDDIVAKALDDKLNPERTFQHANWTECRPSFFQGASRTFLVNLTGNSLQDSSIVLLTCNQNSPLCLEVKKWDAPINFPISQKIFATSISINGQQADPFLITKFSDGDHIDLQHGEQSSVTSQQDLNRRIDFFNETRFRAASDEFAFALDILKLANQEIHISPILDLRKKCQLAPAQVLQQGLSGLGHILVHHVECVIVPIFLEDHWCALELKKKDFAFTVTSVGVPQYFDAIFRKVAADALAFPGASVSHFTMPLPSFQGLCGWVLLKRWFHSFAPEIKNTFSAILSTYDVSASFWPNGAEPTFDNCQVAQRVLEVAAGIRSAFVASFFCPPKSREFWPKSLLVGGMDDEDSKGDEKGLDVPSQEDPWKTFDPWMQSSGLKQAKWEDLRLPSDHPFVTNDGTRVKQVHKQKLSTNTGGVSFATKASLPDLMRIETDHPVAILVPNGDRRVNSSIVPRPDVSGPFEVVVEDPVSSQIYKRQVLLIQAKPKIKYQLAQPTYSATLPELRELVLEIDCRLITRDLANQLAEKPLDSFRAKVADQFPPAIFQGVKIYAYRKFTPKGSDPAHVVHQAMCKLPKEKRVVAIERSGLGYVTCRDFLDKGEFASDLTVIPRFWSIDKSSKDEAIRAVTGLEGFAGLVVSRRGLAPRAWISGIANLRKALLPQDERISELNIGVVPRVLLDSTGWPISISPQEIIKATLHAVKLAPVPTRCQRHLGVTCWQLAFAENPDVHRFVIKCNGELHEILLSKPNSAPAKHVKKQPSKPIANSSSSATPPTVQVVQDDSVSERVSILEAKFQTFEKRQENVERQLESGFENMQSQLRQVLNALSQPREKAPTGETPPPKYQKHL